MDLGRMAGRTVAAALLTAASAVCAAAALAPPAGGIAVSPVRVDLTPQQRGAAVTLSNNGSTRKTLQVELFDWSQEQDADRYTPSQELLANPPLFFLEPGASQIVRIGLPRNVASPTVRERAWRIYFREIVDEAAPAGPTLRVVLRIGVPVFMTPPLAAPVLEWSGLLHADGSVSLRLDNRGSAHVRVAEPRLLAATGADVLARAEGFQYVLPGAWRSWRMAPDRKLKAGPARVAALMEEGAREFPLVLRAE